MFKGSAAYAKASGYASGYDPTRRRAKEVGPSFNYPYGNNGLGKKRGALTLNAEP
jgi:hypothetical protein